MHTVWIDRGSVIGCAMSDGYVSVLGTCELRGSVDGRGMDWFRRTLGKESAAGDAIKKYIVGTAAALIESPETPRGWIGTLAHVVKSFIPAGEEDTIVIDRVPETREEVADMAGRLAQSVSIVERSEGRF